MNKISIIFIIILGVLIMGGSYFGYQYWKKGTPEYSFQQLRDTLKNHDTSAFEKYYDAEEISNNIWPRIKSKYLDYYSANSSSALIREVALAQLDNMEKTFKESFKNSFYEWVRGNSGGPNVNLEAKVAVIAAFLDSKPIFKTRADGTVSTNFDYQSSASKNLQLNFVFKQQKDRQWKITDVQGFEDIFTADLGKEQRESRDALRLANIAQIQLALELSFDANQGYPLTLASLAPKIIPTEPKDPSTSTPYKYVPLKTSDGAICRLTDRCLSYHLGAVLEEDTNSALPGLNLGAANFGFEGNSSDCGTTISSPDKCYDIAP